MGPRDWTSPRREKRHGQKQTWSEVRFVGEGTPQLQSFKQFTRKKKNSVLWNRVLVSPRSTLCIVRVVDSNDIENRKKSACSLILLATCFERIVRCDKGVFKICTKTTTLSGESIPREISSWVKVTPPLADSTISKQRFPEQVHEARSLPFHQNFFCLSDMYNWFH